MEIWMNVNEAVTIPVNVMPLLDDRDFKTKEVAVPYNAEGMKLTWNFVTTSGIVTQTEITPTIGGNYDWVHVGDGMYTLEFPASEGLSVNNDTEGFGWFVGCAAGILPWRGPIVGFRAVALNNDLINVGAPLAKSSDQSVANLVLDKLDQTLETDGETYRFTQNALELTPTQTDIQSLVDAMDNLPTAIYDELSRIPAISFSLPQAGEVNAQAGDTVSFQINNLGNLAGAKKLYFTAKLRKTDPDSNSIVQVEMTEGLKYIMAQAAAPVNGSLTVLDEAVGNIRVRLEAADSVKIPQGTYYFDVKIVEADDEVYTLTQGEITFFFDITKAVD